MREGWKVVRLSEVVNLQSGFAFKSSDYASSGHFLVRIGNVQNGYLSQDNPKFVDLDQKTRRFELNEGDLLTSLTGNIGRVAQVEKHHLPAALNQRVARITVKDRDSLNRGFLSFFLSSTLFRDALDSASHGVAQQNVSPSEIHSIPIPLPPLPEQKRIVAILDEAFAGIDTAVANTRNNLDNARKTFASHLNNVFSKKGEGWVERRLEECIRLKSGDGLTSKAMKDGMYPVYGGNGIAGRHSEFNLSGDNVIIGRVGALCGNARHITERIWLTDNAFRVMGFELEFDATFLTYLLNFKNLRSLARQSAQPVISNSSLKDLLLAFPGIAEQKQIVTTLDTLCAETQRLESLYRRKLDLLSDLRQSLLNKAFSGELTAANLYHLRDSEPELQVAEP